MNVKIRKIFKLHYYIKLSEARDIYSIIIDPELKQKRAFNLESDYSFPLAVVRYIMHISFFKNPTCPITLERVQTVLSLQVLNGPWLSFFL